MKEINQKTISTLLNHLSHDDYADLVIDFINETREHLQDLKNERDSLSKADKVRLVHSIKGSAASLGFDRLSYESSVLEEALKASDINKNSTIFDTYNKYVLKFLLNIINHYELNDRSGL